MTNLNDETLRQEIIRTGEHYPKHSNIKKQIDYLLSIFSGEHALAVEILQNRLDRAKLIRELRAADAMLKERAK